MNKIKDCIDKFDAHIEYAHEKIKEESAQIINADVKVRELVTNFSSAVECIKVDVSNTFEKDLSEVMAEYKKNCHEWCNTIDSFIKGKDFINQFEKSILVVVFGNVNVGKSSVGNFIAGTVDSESDNYSANKKALYTYFGDVPDFYEYDIAGKSDHQEARKKTDSLFKEGYIETTATIQYFTRNNGLTWTDSPGICSVNKANGDLAKKYVEFADLVIFITSSSSPAKNDEVQELKKLFGKKKPVLILINKSDISEKDEVDGKLVSVLKPKSDKDRKKQEDYIKEMFMQEVGDIISNVDAISISRNLALEALREDDNEKFVQSGFPRFFETIGKIFSDNAVKLKMQAPKNRINSMISEIIEGGSIGENTIYGISQYKNSIAQIKSSIEKAKSELDSKAKSSIAGISKEIMDEVSELVHNQAYQVRNGGSGADLSADINKIVTDKTKNLLQEKFKEVLADYNNDMIKQISYNGTGSINVVAKTETIQKTIYDSKTVRRNPQGLIEHIEKIIFKKEFTRTKVTTRTIEESFINGDNSNDVLATISTEIDNSVKSFVELFVDNVKKEYFNKEEILLNKIETLLNELKSELEGECIE